MATRTGPSSANNKAMALTRLNKIEGQARGIRRMVEEDRRYTDILQQIAALKSAADAVALLLLEDFLRDRGADALRRRDADVHVREVVDAIRRFARTCA